MRATAGQVVVDTLAELGARHYYTVPGESFLDVLEATRRNPSTTLVSTRHESGAAFMADADAKLTGMPAVAAATRAPGAANLAIGVHTAFHDSTPMVVLVGQVDSHLYGAGLAFQEIDLAAFYRPITKWSATLSRSGDVVGLARRAFAAATSGRPGPVLLVLPGDVLAEEVGPGGRVANEELETTGGVDAGTAAPDCPAAARQLAPDLAARLRGLLEAAAAPVMVVGGRTFGLSTALVALAERYGIGVYSAFRRQDHFPNDHPAYLGHLTLAPAQETLVALRSADLVLALGCRLGEVTTQRFSLPSDRSYLVHVDPDADRAASVDPRSTTGHVGPGRQSDLAVPADVGAVVAALLTGRAAPLGSDRWAGAHRAYLEDSTVPAGRAGAPLDPTSVVEAMTEVVPADAIVTSDAGNFSIALHRFWRFRFPHTQLAPTSGAMGYAVPAAVAAGLVRPGQLAVAVVGDGGYLMTGQEVETAVRYGAKVVVLAVRNGLYGTIAMHQARTFGTTWGVDIGPVDIAAHARSLGAAGFTATDSASLREALVAAVGAPGPAVVDVVVDPDAITPTATLSAIASASRERSPHGGTEPRIGARRARAGRARTGQRGT